MKCHRKTGLMTPGFFENLVDTGTPTAPDALYYKMLIYISVHILIRQPHADHRVILTPNDFTNMRWRTSSFLALFLCTIAAAYFTVTLLLLSLSAYPWQLSKTRFWEQIPHRCGDDVGSHDPEVLCDTPVSGRCVSCVRYFLTLYCQRL